MTALQNTLKHQFMVNKLAKDPVDIINSLSPHKAHLLHMLVGIFDEIHEFNIAKTNTDKENMLEELGDMLFYCEGFLLQQPDSMDIDLADYKKFAPMSRDETYQLLGRTLKRHVFYEQELVIKDLVNCYQNIREWIRFDASQIGLTIVDVQNHNMEKLAKRYPNFDYSDIRAKTRADKVESGETPIEPGYDVHDGNGHM